MQLYGIGDLHLSLGVPEKPMDIFHGWENYMQTEWKLPAAALPEPVLLRQRFRR